MLDSNTFRQEGICYSPVDLGVDMGARSKWSPFTKLPWMDLFPNLLMSPLHVCEASHGARSMQRARALSGLP